MEIVENGADLQLHHLQLFQHLVHKNGSAANVEGKISDGRTFRRRRQSFFAQDYFYSNYSGNEAFQISL